MRIQLIVSLIIVYLSAHLACYLILELVLYYMEFLTTLLPRVLSGILSLLDAANLRNRVHAMEDEHELMWTALDDIARMHKGHASAEQASRTLKKITRTYGR